MLIRILLLFCILTDVSATLCAKPLQLGWEEWQPYQYNDGQKITGLDIELITSIVKNAGCEIKYVNVPWSRGLQLLQKGDLDLVASASYSKDREKFAFFSEPYRDEKVALFVKKGDQDKYRLKNIADIVNNKMQIGAQTDFYYGESVANLLKDKNFSSHIQPVASLQENIDKLVAGKLQGLLSDDYALFYQLKENKLESAFVEYPVAVHSNQVHIMVSKASASKELVSALNNSLNLLKSNGEFAKILAKYGKKS